MDWVNTWNEVRKAVQANEQAAKVRTAAAFHLPPQDNQKARTLTLDDHLDEYALAVASLVGRKQRDYGPHAINGAPGGKLTGINVRLHDKLSRAAHVQLLAEVSNESLFDTYLDIAGYALIAMLVLDGKWPA